MVTRDFVISGQATSEFVQNEIREAKADLSHTIEQTKAELRHEITLVKLATGKMIAAAVGVLLAGIPLIQVLLSKFS